LTERRFLVHFPKRAEAIEKPGLYPGLLGLLGGANVEAEAIQPCLYDWQSAFEAIPESRVPADLHPGRQAYYRQAFEALLAGERPHDVLWPLLRTWTNAILQLPEGAKEKGNWQGTLDQWELMGEGFHQRVKALDAYIDVVEETLEQWGREHGA
jgi:hypothetical protein